jgi:hypothetical protein
VAAGSAGTNSASSDAATAGTDSGSSGSGQPQTSWEDTTGAGASEDGTSYANCSEARDAGAAPLYSGDPGYSSKLDRDGDGVACE